MDVTDDMDLYCIFSFTCTFKIMKTLNGSECQNVVYFLFSFFDILN